MKELTDSTQDTPGAISEVQGQSFNADEVLQGEPMAHLSIQDSPIRETPILVPKINDGSNPLPVAKRTDELTNDTSSVEVDSKIFFIDTRGTREMLDTKPSPLITRRPLSPAMSDSSNEIVVFSGRGRVGVNSGTNHTSSLTVDNVPHRSKSPRRRAVKIIDDPVVPSASSTSINQGHYHSPWLLSKGLVGPPDKAMNLLSNAQKGSSMKRLSENQGDEEEILADYIANINDSDDQKYTTNYDLNWTRDLGGTHDRTDELLDENALGSILQSDASWDLSDLADLSTSSEDLASVGRVLSKRKRPLGVQYLVTEGGHTVDDARWIPLSALVMPGAEQHIRIYESKLSKAEEYLTDSNGSDDDISNAAADLQKEMDNSLDEQDLKSRRRERMVDEKIARLLSKQEKLGVWSRDKLLYDGDEDLLPSRKESALRNRGQTDQFTNHLPSTTAFTRVLNADAPDDVDVIDRGRRNLRKKSKGRRGIPGLELTDTEFENSIQLARENDRAKKKIRKQEREQLRAQGLLGKKNKANLKSKYSEYSEGMSTADIKNAIEGFLSSSLDR